MVHRERLAALEKGADLPPWPDRVAVTVRFRRSTASLLLSGLIWLAIGLGGMVAAFVIVSHPQIQRIPEALPPYIALIGLPVALVGVAHLIVYWVRRRNSDDGPAPLPAAVVALAAVPPLGAAGRARSDGRRPGDRDDAFWKVYNACDTAAFRGFFTADVEFYHDRGGPTIGLDALDTALATKLCGGASKLRREIVAGTIRWSILRNGDVVYGAIVAGEHVFYVREPGKAEFLDGRARFATLWLLKDGAWKMARLLSYDHGRRRRGERARARAVRRLRRAPTEDLQHREHDDAGHRHVQPDRERPAGQAPVRGEPARERQIERREHQRQRHHRQQDVRDQDREVDRPDRALAEEPRVAVQRVVGDVRHQEHARRGQRRAHPALVHVAAAAADRHHAEHDRERRWRC